VASSANGSVLEIILTCATYSPKVVKSGQYPTLSPDILSEVRSDFILEVGAVFEGLLTGYQDYQDAIRNATLAKTSRSETL